MNDDEEVFTVHELVQRDLRASVRHLDDAERALTAAAIALIRRERQA